MTNAMRQFKAKAGVLDSEHEFDAGSISFSLTMAPTEAVMYVHWGEQQTDGLVNYHMQMITQYRFREGLDAKELHRDMDNVLDWGVSIRKDYFKELVKKIRANILADAKNAEGNGEK